MPRLFTGIKIPGKIAQVLDLKRGKLRGARWVDVEDYHITLRFIGDVELSLAREISQMLGQIKHRGFNICIHRLGVFAVKKPRTLFGSVNSNEELLHLQAKHERLMVELGLKSETRKYAPHVTLARLSSIKEADLALYLLGQGTIEPLEFEVSGFQLFSAKDSIGGGPYVIEGEYPF